MLFGLLLPLFLLAGLGCLLARTRIMAAGWQFGPAPDAIPAVRGARWPQAIRIRCSSRFL